MAGGLRMSWRTWVVVAVAFGGCDSVSAPPPPALGVRVASPSFELAIEEGFITGEVRLTVTNHGNRTRWLATPSGNPFFLQRLEQGRWRRVWSPAYATIGWPAPTPIAPGEVRSLTFSIYGYRSGPGVDPYQEFPSWPGEYRVVLEGVFPTRESTDPNGELVPIAERASDSFQFVFP